MGTLYYLVKRGSKEYFDLNKGFGSLFPLHVLLDIHASYTRESLNHDIMRIVTSPTFRLKGLEADSYSVGLTNEIWNWVGDDEVVFMRDSTFDDIGYDDFIETGDRFKFLNASLIPYSKSRTLLTFDDLVSLEVGDIVYRNDQRLAVYSKPRLDVIDDLKEMESGKYGKRKIVFATIAAGQHETTHLIVEGFEETQFYRET